MNEGFDEVIRIYHIDIPYYGHTHTRTQPTTVLKKESAVSTSYV